MSSIEDALDGMDARALEGLQERIAKRLRACLVCGADGAVAVSGRARLPGVAGSSAFSLLMCPACVARHRRPAGRADAPG